MGPNVHFTPAKNYALLLNGDVKIALSQKFNMDPLRLGSRPTLTSHGPHSKLFHFWVNTCFLALGHSCPLTHTVADGRGRTGSLVTVSTTNRFSPLEVESPLLDARSALHGGLRVRLDKGQIDKAAKDGSGLFPGDFAVELVLATAGEERGPGGRGRGSRQAGRYSAIPAAGLHPPHLPGAAPRPARPHPQLRAARVLRGHQQGVIGEAGDYR